MSDILALAGAINGLAAAVREANGAPAPKAETKPKAEAKPKAETKPKDDRDYEKDIRPTLVALSKQSREAMAEVLGKFTNPVSGEPCVKGVEVDPSDWDELLKQAKAKSAELDV